MFTRSLFTFQRFFASSYKVSKEGFLLPLPPKRPPSIRSVLLNILKEKDIKSTKLQLNDSNFAAQERQEAQEKSDKLKKEFQAKFDEYEKQYGFPKRPLNKYIIYVNQSIKEKQLKAGIQTMKELGESFKTITEEQKQALNVEANKERERYLQQKQEYEQRLSQLKVPDIKRSHQYALYVEDIFKEKKLSMKEIADLWKSVPQAKKDEYAAKAVQLNKEAEERLNQFVKQHNLTDEEKQVIVKGYLDKEETRELIEKTVKKEKEVDRKERNKVLREKRVEQNAQKREKLREKKAAKREKVKLQRQKENATSKVKVVAKTGKAKKEKVAVKVENS